MKLGSVRGLLLVPEGADPIIGRIDRAAELGLGAIGVAFREPRAADPTKPLDGAYMSRVAEHAAKKGITLCMTGGGSWGSPDPEQRKLDVERLIADLLEVNKHTGIAYSSATNRPMSLNRWAPEPPLDERIDIIAENLGKVADAVATVGMSLGVENHCDYRGYEIAAMLEKANRPNLGAQLDTGNAFTVFEDPMDAAKALAKWTRSVHLKDVKVTPLAPAPWSGARTETVPLGQGHVDNAAIVKMLREQAPDAANLALLVEPLAMPAESEREAHLRESLAWCRKYLAEYL